MRALVYCCRAAKEGRNASVPYNYAAILEESRDRFARAGITGILTYQDGYFFHCLEGDEKDIEQVMKRTIQDGRYNHFEVLMSEKVVSRTFGCWKMTLAKDIWSDTCFNHFMSQYRIWFRRLFEQREEIISRFCSHEQLVHKV